MARRSQPGPRVATTLYRFGDCRIDLSGRELRRAGELVVLSPRVFDCLALLIAHHDRAVGRDELVAHVWGKTEVTDTLLGQTILKARRAIGDSAAGQKSIRTIPRFGYAWVAPLEAVEGEAEAVAAGGIAAAAVPAAEPPERAAVSMRARVAAAIVLVVALVATGVWFARRDGAALRTAAAPDAAAVLPIAVQAPPEWSWVRLGLMEVVAARLREGGQRVVPGDNVVAIARAAASDEGGERVRAATGARHLVAGAATLNPDGWTLRFELRDGATVLEAEAHDADVLRAGQLGADRLLQLLGREPPPAPAGPLAGMQLVQRVEAALLTNDLTGARQLLESADPALRESPELRLQRAKLDFRSGDFDAASQRLQALLAASPAEVDPLLRAKVLNGIGHVAMRRGQVEGAASAYAEAARLLEGQSEPRELGHAYMGRAIAKQSRARYDEASTDLARAHVAFELAGDGLALARVEANEGLMDAARDRHAAAAATLDRAAQRFERFGALNELAMTSSALVGVHLALLDPPSALDASERAWRIRERLEDGRIRSALSINRALALEANGRVGEGGSLLEAVARAADPPAGGTVHAVARAALARIRLDEGKVQAAMDLSQAAIAALGPDAETRDRLGAWQVAIRALRAAGHAREAGQRTAGLLDWTAAQREPVAAIFAQLALAEQAAAEKRDDEASRAYQAALAGATREGVPADIAEVAASYGRYLIAHGDLAGASAVVGLVARWASLDYGCALLQLRLHAALGERQAWSRSLAQARRLAGERTLPAGLGLPPEGRRARRGAPRKRTRNLRETCGNGIRTAPSRQCRPPHLVPESPCARLHPPPS